MLIPQGVCPTHNSPFTSLVSVTCLIAELRKLTSLLFIRATPPVLSLKLRPGYILSTLVLCFINDVIIAPSTGVIQTSVRLLFVVIDKRSSFIPIYHEQLHNRVGFALQFVFISFILTFI